MGGHHVTSHRRCCFPQLRVAPPPGLGFGAGLALFGPADLEVHPLGAAPGGQLCSNRTGVLMPAVVSVPEVQGPGVSVAEVP